MTTKFLIPFADDGDKSEIPLDIQTDGSISRGEGWGFDYSRNPSTDPAAKRIDRGTMNWLFWAITEALGQIQQTGAPDWITAADNGGTAFAYGQGAIVRHGGVTYGSVAAANTAEPGTDPAKWAVLDLSLLAPLASPAFSGTPTVPTAAPGTSTTQAASTAFVAAAVAAISLTGYAQLAVAQTFTKAQRGQVVTLTDAATITPDFADGNYYTVTLAGNRTLDIPSNLSAGQSGCIWIVQDATGSRTLSFNAAWDFAGGTAPSLSTAAGAVDRLDYVVRTAGSIHAQLSKAVS